MTDLQTNVLYYGDNLDIPRIQILTMRELLEEGKKPKLPLLVLSPYQQAERVADKRAAEQRELFP